MSLSQQEYNPRILRGNQAFYHKAMPCLGTTFQMDLNDREMPIDLSLFADSVTSLRAPRPPFPPLGQGLVSKRVPLIESFCIAGLCMSAFL